MFALLDEAILYIPNFQLESHWGSNYRSWLISDWKLMIHRQLDTTYKATNKSHSLALVPMKNEVWDYLQLNII